ncbi:hypothetical protein MRB53_042139 [Persea americana]|nr:hypothetical protein MRB53_042139 [Persea americana]
MLHALQGRRLPQSSLQLAADCQSQGIAQQLDSRVPSYRVCGPCCPAVQELEIVGGVARLGFRSLFRGACDWVRGAGSACICRSARLRDSDGTAACLHHTLCDDFCMTVSVSKGPCKTRNDYTPDSRCGPFSWPPEQGVCRTTAWPKSRELQSASAPLVLSIS